MKSLDKKFGIDSTYMICYNYKNTGRQRLLTRSKFSSELYASALVKIPGAYLKIIPAICTPHSAENSSQIYEA